MKKNLFYIILFVFCSKAYGLDAGFLFTGGLPEGRSLTFYNNETKVSESIFALDIFRDVELKFNFFFPVINNLHMGIVTGLAFNFSLVNIEENKSDLLVERAGSFLIVPVLPLLYVIRYDIVEPIKYMKVFAVSRIGLNFSIISTQGIPLEHYYQGSLRQNPFSLILELGGGINFYNAHAEFGYRMNVLYKNFILEEEVPVSISYSNHSMFISFGWIAIDWN